MNKIDLNYNKEIQGEFKINKLNLVLVFQVNCPGCFTYALPLYNKIYNAYKTKGVSFLALSTAFEDYDKNTLVNTENLVNQGTLIGETKTYMNNQGIDKLPYTLDFPIAMDTIIDEKELDYKKAINTICKLNPNYNIWPEFEKKSMASKVENYLKSLDKIALSFTLNQLRGTPSFILFNSELEILKEWFGHVDEEEIKQIINKLIENNKT
jgi:hypothetical protein